MGTSLSNNGPKDKIPLLPKWALAPEEEPTTEPDEEPADPESGQEPTQENEVDADSVAEANGDPTTAVGKDDDADANVEAGGVPPERRSSSWSWAKRLLGSAAGSGGGSANYRKAARSYVSAKRGAHKAARAAISGREATRRLGGFLSDIVRGGIDAALRTLELSSYVGRDAISMLAAISNALAPDGASPEQAVAREAVNEILEGLYERFVLADGDLARLDALTIEDVRQAMVDCVCSYVFHRWLQELGRKIEEKAISPGEAVRLERDVKQFVHDTVVLDLGDADVLTIDWDGPGGHKLVDDVYTEAYRLLGNSE